MSGPATKRKIELEEDGSCRQHKNAACSTQHDQEALTTQ